ncbi:MAG: polysaccharide deacetylase family protein [Phycisphaerae bacterium]|nr:polysaccharide deacetylase family protein [Saprospiraceae bacterium]
MYINTLNGITGYNGAGLPNKTLSLTFDDGPGKSVGSFLGPQTVKIAKYLFEENIRATFFVIGKHVLKYPEAIKKIKRYGHLVANHSFDHPSLPSMVSNPSALVDEILKTDNLIIGWIDGGTTYLRPPYGSWDNNVTDILNRDLLASLNHLGPIMWDIDSADWNTWENNLDLLTLVDDYYQLISDLSRNNGKQNGIVLMHDSSGDSELAKSRNRCLEVVKRLIPKLKLDGYSFVRIDEINDVIAAATLPLRFALKGANNLFVSPQNGGGGIILVNGPSIGGWEPLIAFNLGGGKIAIQCSNGKFVSPQNGGGGNVLADGPSIGGWEPLEVIRVYDGHVAFRTINGHYLTLDNSTGKLMANVTWVNNSEIFEFNPM